MYHIFKYLGGVLNFSMKNNQVIPIIKNLNLIIVQFINILHIK